MAGIEGFVCNPMQAARITRSTCTARHAQAKRERADGSPSIRFPKCGDCRVGIMHAREGRPRVWPDGSPVVRIRIEVASPTGGTPSKPGKGTGNVSPTSSPVQAPAPGKTATAGRNKGERGIAPATEGSDASSVRKLPGKPRRWIQVGDDRDTLAGWARRLGVAHTVIAERLRRGWDPVLAVTTPKGTGTRERIERTPNADPIGARVFAKLVKAARELGLDVERIGSSPRGDMLVVRTTEAP